MIFTWILVELLLEVEWNLTLNFVSLTVCPTSTGGATSSTSGGATASASSNVTPSNSGGSITILSPTGLSLSQSVFVSKFLNPYRQMQPANQVASKRRKINRSAVITHAFSDGILIS
jgi:hypothetical protein